jgi:N-acetylglucosaminyldiphosphoundecaprenol N-acetyl-beta-D-mannosaminyltransferase
LSVLYAGRVSVGLPTRPIDEPTKLFEIDVQTAPPADLLRRIFSSTEERRRQRVAYVNAHVLNQASRNPELREALQQSDLVYCDGYGVRLAARVVGLPVPHRMTGADWIWGVASLCQGLGRSLYLLGSDAGSSSDAAAALRRWYPTLDVRGTHHGYFQLDSPHSERVLEHIGENRPDILLVGMGTPVQELWVHRNAERIDAGVIWTVGALFDYLSGRTARAPHWLADNGLEWVFRLAIEPKRMWRRYLLGNPAFLRRVWRERRERARPRA